jgi:hypothetical protein
MLGEIGCVSIENYGVVRCHGCGSSDLDSIRVASVSWALFLGAIEERIAGIDPQF